jgi:Do/DeqQ family serine protease
MAYNLFLWFIKKNGNMKKNLFWYILVAMLAGGITSYAVVSANKSNSSSDYFHEEDTTFFHKTSFSPDDYPDFTFAAENAVKAVVHVKVVKMVSSQPYSLFDFFGYGTPRGPREQVGAGSGVIITKDGYIVTNNHVVEGAEEIEITLDNNKVYEAELVGTDPATDVALLKIEADNLPYLRFGNSDDLRLGEWVLAIGNPYNLRSTVTAGIVSAKARSMSSLYDNEFKIEAFIQTDAAVNSGNSGGALVNIRGELVGINTAIASRTGDFAGYSFAVPTSIVKKIVEDIIDYGSVQRALLGISMMDVTDEIAKENELKDTRGVYIADVVPDSPADKSGIESGDVLVSVNGVDVDSAPEVQEQVNRYRPDDKISVTIVRDNKQKEVSVVLKSRGAQIAMLNREDQGVLRMFGADLQNASEETLDELDLNGGVEVISVSAGKFRDAGIKKGFIITYINQEPVNDIKALQSVVQRSRRSVLIEGVYPDGEVVYYGMGL